MKVLKSLENRGVLLKGTTSKITSQEGRFLNFLRPLMTAGLPYVCNKWHDILMSMNLSDIAILNIKGSDYCYKILQTIDMKEKSGTL